MVRNQDKTKIIANKIKMRGGERKRLERFIREEQTISKKAWNNKMSS